MRWGIWGVGAVAVLDSSSIPVPMDAILALYVWNDKRPFLALLPDGGRGFGHRRVAALRTGPRRRGTVPAQAREPRKFERLRDRFERQEFLAVMIPSMMPPPTPWKVFIFASGVFEMRVALSARRVRGKNGALAGALPAGPQARSRSRRSGGAARW